MPIPDRSKIPGVCYAWTDEIPGGEIPCLELPVFDVTHPAFDCEVSSPELDALIDQMVASGQRLAQMPAPVLEGILQKSLLMRGMIRDSANTYTSGMMTYLNKLPPACLGDGYAGPLDRQWAASLTPVTFRWRMRNVASLLAEVMARILPAHLERPVHLINIAGGPGMDSINALILLYKQHPDLLADRQITIHLLDPDPAGPHFGARALAALQAGGAPLSGLFAELDWVPYNWNQPDSLSELAKRLEKDAAWIGSSEGGLFEYAADEVIIANLAILREITPPDFGMIGPVVRDPASLDLRLRATERVPGRPAVRYLGLTAFNRLAAQAGWCITQHLDGLMHQVVELRKV